MSTAAELELKKALLAQMELQEGEEGNNNNSDASDSDEEEEEEAAIVPRMDYATAAAAVRASEGRGKSPIALAAMAAAAAAASAGTKRYRPSDEDDEDDDEDDEDDAPPQEEEGTDDDNDALSGYQVSKQSAAKKSKPNPPEQTAAAAAAGGAGSSSKKSSTPANVVHRDNKVAVANMNPVIGEKFMRGDVQYTVVSTVKAKGRAGWFPVKNAHKTQKFYQPDWEVGFMDMVFNARISDRTDMAAFESFVQTSQFQFFVISQTGARNILTNDMRAKHKKGSANATKAYKADAVSHHNRFAKLDGEDDGTGDRTWLPWVLYTHTLANRHEAPAAAASSSKAPVVAGAAKRVRTSAASSAAASNSSTIVPPPLLVTLAKEYCDNELEPHCRKAKSLAGMVIRLDSSVQQFALSWTKEDMDEVNLEMVNRYNEAKSRMSNITHASFATTMQVRMFMMIHPAGLAILQELRNKLQKEALDEAAADGEYI